MGRLGYAFVTTLAWRLVVLSMLAIQPAWANSIAVREAWVRPTVPGQTVASAYMEITARDAARLVAVRSPISPRVEIHWMQMDGGVMRMREVGALDLPKKTTVSLKPGGYHLMLLKLKQPVQVGDKIPLTLIVETKAKREVLVVEAIARNTQAASDHGHAHH